MVSIIDSGTFKNVSGLDPIDRTSNFRCGERVYYWVKFGRSTSGYRVEAITSDGRSESFNVPHPSSEGWEWWNWYVVYFWFDNPPCDQNFSIDLGVDGVNIDAKHVRIAEAPQQTPPPTPTPEPTPQPDPTPTPSPFPDGTERVNCSDPRAIGNLPDGTCFANIIVTPPPIPTPQFELYEIDIVTPINPNLPNWVVDRLRSVMLAGGWELSNISKSADGYKLQVAKQGSVSAVVIITMISVVLALIAVKIISTTITRLSDNKRDQVVSENIKNSVNTVIDFCNQNGLSQEECQELIEGVKNVYDEVIEPPPKDDGGLFGGIFDNVELLVGAVLVISLINTMKR